MVGGYVDECVSASDYPKECEHETHLAPIDLFDRHGLHNHTLFHSLCVVQDSYQYEFYTYNEVHA